MIKLIKMYVLNILIAIDQLGNALLAGDPDETISSRCGKIVRNAQKADESVPWFWDWLGKFLELVDPGHLKKSIESDEGKRAVWRNTGF